MGTRIMFERIQDELSPSQVIYQAVIDDGRRVRITQSGTVHWSGWVEQGKQLWVGVTRYLTDPQEAIKRAQEWIDLQAEENQAESGGDDE